MRYFGYYHDDALYFSSAQALAQGRGYIMPSLPGAPPQTKYPVLYPWLLSWVWRWDPSFPANLLPAVSLTAMFGCWSLIAAFQLLRKLNGIGDWPALLLVGLCAFQPHFLILSGAVLSDVPFVALVLTVAVVADSAMRRNSRIWLGLAAGALAGLSVLLRNVGIAVVAGIFATAVYRRAYRQGLAFCLATTPFLAAALWFSGPHSWPRWESTGGATLAPGWRQTWAFYTSYAEYWKLTVPGPLAFLKMLGANLDALLQGPAIYFFLPLVKATPQLGIALAGVLAAGVLAGIIRQARKQEWKPIHFIFLFYAAVILFWNYPLMDRFLLWLLPLFYAGVWLEGKDLLAMVLSTVRSAQPLTEKLLAGALSLGLLVLAGTAAWNYLDGFRLELRAKGAQRAAMLDEKMQVYDWLRQNTDSQTRVITYDDASLYLFAGRQAIRPIQFSVELYYTDDARVLERDLAHFADTARQVGARFWVISNDDDFGMDLGKHRRLLDTRMAQLKSVLPMAFHSRENIVQVYDLSCVLQPLRAECKGAVPVLFPEGSGSQESLPGDHNQPYTAYSPLQKDRHGKSRELALLRRDLIRSVHREYAILIPCMRVLSDCWRCFLSVHSLSLSI